ncbi:MAG TPA: hypothetical protein VEV83_21715, partial [Parafilimonas sp.]|nr:hypothetical protein [Parafilimonas sp.]
MRTRSFRMILAAALIVLFSNCSKKDTPPQGVLIAYYQLLNDAADSTGLNGPMTLQNTPFENGGIYCNGIYSHSPDPNYCTAQTPAINSLKFQSFSISMDFLVTEKKRQPVWIIGTSCRWLGFYLEADGTVALLYNNWDFLATSKAYSLNEWHNAKISFDGTTANIFLDSSLAGSLKFGNGYVPLNYDVCGTSDTEIGVTNFSNGEVLEGYVRNL